MDKETHITEHRATLGCGTLILIALIVIIFSGAGIDAIQKDVREMKAELEVLQDEIELLRIKLDEKIE